MAGTARGLPLRRYEEIDHADVDTSNKRTRPCYAWQQTDTALLCLARLIVLVACAFMPEAQQQAVVGLGAEEHLLMAP